MPALEAIGREYAVEAAYHRLGLRPELSSHCDQLLHGAGHPSTPDEGSPVRLMLQERDTPALPQSVRPGALNAKSREPARAYRRRLFQPQHCAQLRGCSSRPGRQCRFRIPKARYGPANVHDQDPAWHSPNRLCRPVWGTVVAGNMLLK